MIHHYSFELSFTFIDNKWMNIVKVQCRNLKSTPSLSYQNKYKN